MSNIPKTKYDHGIPDGHAFAETRDLHPNDIRLRNAGYKVRSRPKRGPALWAYHSTTFTEQEALEMLDEELLSRSTES